MGKSKDKQPAKAAAREQSDKPALKVGKKALDPALASLFASSVRLLHRDRHSNMLTNFSGWTSRSTPKVTLPGSRAEG
jgi:hypothetical protein